MGRAPCCEKVGLKRGRWTAEEDQILINYIEANGEGSWRTLPKNAGLLRCGKSCRLRWINYLRSGLKRGNISTEEEELIIKLQASLGNRWSLIAGQLPGRTDNEIKNHWNSHLRGKLDSFRVMPKNQSDPPSPASVVMDSAQARSGGNKRRTRSTTRSTRPPNPKKNKRARARATDPSQGPEPSKHTGGDDNVIVSRPCTPTLEKESISSAMFWEGDDHHHLRDQEEDNMLADLIMDPLAEEEATASLSSTKILECDDVFCRPETTCSESAKPSTTDDVRCRDNNTTEVCLESNATISLPGLEHGRYNSSNMSASASSDDSWVTSGMEVPAVVENGGDEQKLDDWNNWNDWQWDDEVVNDLATVCGDKADILSWLWDSGYSPGDGDFGAGNLAAAAAGVAIDDEKHNEIVAWLFS